MRACLYLVTKGVPFDVAFSLDEEEILAWNIIIGEQNGGRYSHKLGKWLEPDESEDL